MEVCLDVNISASFREGNKIKTSLSIIYCPNNSVKASQESYLATRLHLYSLSGSALQKALIASHSDFLAYMPHYFPYPQSTKHIKYHDEPQATPEPGRDLVACPRSVHKFLKTSVAYLHRCHYILPSLPITYFFVPPTSSYKAI